MKTRFAKMMMVIGVMLLLLPVAPLAQPALADGGDLSIDFIAAAPYTYDHATGGGAYNSRIIGKDKDGVESLEGGDYACHDIVTYLPRIWVVGTPVDANQTVDLQFSFLAETTGQPGAAHADVTYVGVNYGVVQNGAGPGGVDSGIQDDGGSTATILEEYFDPAGTTPFNGAHNLILKIRLTDLEAGESVVVRIDTLLDCLDGSRPTGNLQATFNWGKVVEANGLPVDPPDVMPGGEQTINFKISDLPVPTAVTLANLAAAPAGNAIQVNWETASELDSLGFNLYRATSATGPRTRLNASLIYSQAPGSPLGQAYQFVDSAVRPGVTYYYWLEAVDTAGGSAINGPVSATVAPLRRAMPVRPRLAPGIPGFRNR